MNHLAALPVALCTAWKAGRKATPPVPPSAELKAAAGKQSVDDFCDRVLGEKDEADKDRDEREKAERDERERREKADQDERDRQHQDGDHQGHDGNGGGHGEDGGGD